MTKKLETDPFELSPGLDMDFDDMEGLGFDQVKPKSRNPISDIVKGTYGGVKDTLLDPGFLAKTTRTVLPKEYGVIAERATEVRDSLTSLYDQTAREVKPQLARVAQKINKLVPNELGMLKKATSSISEFLGNDNDSDYGDSRASAEEQTISGALGQIFQVQQENNEQIEGQRRAEGRIQSAIEQKRFISSSKTLQSIDSAVSQLASYESRVTQAYQKKSLELQFRSYFVQAELLKDFKQYREVTKAQMDAVQKNTSLPDYAKTRATEKFRELSRDKFIGKFQDGLFGDNRYIERLKNRISSVLKQKVEDFKQGMDTGMMGLDMVETTMETNKQMAESGIEVDSPLKMAAGVGGSEVVRHYGNKLGKWLNGQIDEDNPIAKGIFKGATVAKNLPGYLNEAADRFANSEWYEKNELDDGFGGIAAQATMGLLNMFKDNSADMSVDSEYDPDNHTGRFFDNKAHRSLTEIIPGYLARILREQTMLRTGKEVELTLYDTKRERFVDTGTAATSVKEFMEKKFKSFGHQSDLEEATSILLANQEVTDKQYDAVKEFIRKISNKRGTYTPEMIRNSDEYMSLDGETSSLVDRALTSRFEDHDAKEKNHMLFTNKMLSARTSKVDAHAEIEKYIRDGYADILIDQGIVHSKPDGGYKIDYEEYERRISKGVKREAGKLPAGAVSADAPKPGEGEEPKPVTGPIITSDINAKSNLKILNPKHALDAFRKTKLYNWFYKNDAIDKQEDLSIDWGAKKGQMLGGKKTGPMAQDVNRNFGEAAAPNGTSIDVVNMNGNTMAAIQELNNRQEEMIRSDSNKTNLQTIADNTSKIAELLEQGKGSGGTGVFSSDMFANFRPNTTYFDRITNMMRDSGGLIGKAAGDLFSGLKTGFNFTKDKIVKPGAAKISKIYSNNKDTVKDGVASLFKKATDFAGKTIDLGKDILFNKMPTGLKKLKDWAVIGKNAIKDFIREKSDIYIKGQLEPALRLKLMEAGHYRDQLTGKIINNFEDIKGAVVDASGNIVLSVEDFAKGLYNNQGQELLNPFIKMAKSAVERVKNGAIGAWKLGKNLFGKAKEKIGGFNMLNWSMPMGLDFMGSRSYEILVDIRDILRYKLMNGEELPEEFKTKIEKKSISETLAPKVEAVKEKAKEVKEKAKAKSTELKDKAKDKAEKLKEQALAKKAELKEKAQAKIDELKAQFDEKYPGKRDSLFKQFTSAKDKVKDLWAEKGGRFKEGLDKVSNLKDKLLNAWKKPEDKLSIDWGAKKGQMFKKEAPSVLDKVTDMTKGPVASGLMSKVTGLIPGIGKAGSLVSGLSGLFGKKKEEEQPEDKEPKAKSKKKAKEEPSDKKEEKPEASEEGFIAKIKRAFGKKAAFNDADGDGDRDGNWKERLAKEAEDEKARKEANKPKADLDPKYVAEKGVIGTIVGMLGKALGFMTGKVGGLFSGVTSIFSKLATVGGVAGKLIGGTLGIGKAVLGGGIKVAKGIGSVLGGAGKVLGTIGKPLTGLFNLGKATRVGMAAVRVANIARTGLMIGGLATGGVGGALAAAGSIAMTALGAVLASPVAMGAIAIGATAYGGYKLYKYLTRDKIDDFTKVRVYQYGFTEKDETYNHRLVQLENYLLDGRIGYSGGQAYILEKKIEPNELLEIFGIDPEDKEMINRFTEWFNGRFKPFFLTHVTALFAVNKKVKLNEVEDKLGPEEKLQYLEKVSYDSGPYDKTTSPFKALDALSDGTQAAIGLIKKLTEDTKKKVKEKKEGKPEGKDTYADPNAKKPETKPVSINPEANKPTPVVKSETKNDGVVSDDAGQTKMNKDISVKDEVVRGMSLKVAGGPIANGENGRQYLKLGPDTNLDGMNPALLKNLYGMAQEFFESTGKNIVINSGKRSYQEQAALYASNPEKAAKPGRSLHEFGLALDIPSVYTDQLEKLGLMRKYGFTRPVGGEPWHTEPAGIQVNLNQAKENPTFADQAIESSLFKGGGGVGSINGTPKGKRDSKLAVSLLNVDAQKAPTSNADEISDKLNPTPVEQNSQEKSNGNNVYSMSSYRDRLKKDAQGADETRQAMDDFHAKQSQNSDNVRKVSFSVQQDSRYSKKNDLPDYEDKPKTTGTTGPVTSGKPVDTSNKEEVKAAISEAAKKAGSDPTMMATFAAVESSLNPNAKASTSSASGPFQFTKGTWQEQLRMNGNKYSIDPNTPPTDITASTLLASEYVKSNMRKLSSVKPNPNLTDAYLAHFLGPGGARKMLSADPNANMSELFPDAARDNPNLFYSAGKSLTAAQFYSKVSNKLSTTAKQFGIDVPQEMVVASKADKPLSESTRSGNANTSSATTELEKPKASINVNGQQRAVPDVQRTPMSNDSSTIQVAEKRPSVFNGGMSYKNIVPVDQGQALNIAPIKTELETANKSLAELVRLQTEALEYQKKVSEAIEALSKLKDGKSDNQVNPDLRFASGSYSKPIGEPALDIKRRA